MQESMQGEYRFRNIYTKSSCLWLQFLLIAFEEFQRALILCVWKVVFSLQWTTRQLLVQEAKTSGSLHFRTPDLEMKYDIISEAYVLSTNAFPPEICEHLVSLLD